MTKQISSQVEVRLEHIVGGGQTIANMENGLKLFVWGGLPGELAEVLITKKKSKLAQGVVTQVIDPSSERIEPRDPESYLSTSPWQIMKFDVEQHYKAALIEEAFELHDIVVPEPIDVYTDGVEYQYRNKVEFSWYGDETIDEQTGEASETLDLAFFKRGTKGKIVVNDSALLPDAIMKLAREIRDFLGAKRVHARDLKTLIIRSNQSGDAVWQLYTKVTECDFMSPEEAATFSAIGGEVIYSDPRSPASRITKRLLATGTTTLTDEILGTTFSYNAESFFQVNIPVYEQALRDMKQWVEPGEVVDMYAGVGSIGLTIGGGNCTLVEINESAVNEMRRNIATLENNALIKAVLAPSEKALEYITAEATIIVDPPRAGLHKDVIYQLLDVAPPRIIYLSCNPVTQARDVAQLSEKYGIRAHRGYNFFPRTPHIEHLVVLDRKS